MFMLIAWLVTMLAAPVILAGVATYAWRQTIPRPWLFGITAGVLLYVLAGLVANWAVDISIGVSGQVPPGEATEDPISWRLTTSMVALLVGSGAILLAMKRAFGRR